MLIVPLTRKPRPLGQGILAIARCDPDQLPRSNEVFANPVERTSQERIRFYRIPMKGVHERTRYV